VGRCGVAGGDGLPVWSGFQRIHAGDGCGAFSQNAGGCGRGAVHGGHSRRCGGHIDSRRQCVPAGGRRGQAGGVFRPWVGWDGRREQEHHQDHCQVRRGACAGLFCLRLEEGGGGDRVAPAVRGAADPRAVSDRPGGFCRVPSIRFAAHPACARSGRRRGRLPAQQPLRPGRCLGAPPARHPTGHHRQTTQVLRDRRLPGRPRDRHGGADQHDHADVLFCPVGSASDRAGDRGNQGGDSQDVCAQGPGNCRAQQRGRGPCDRESCAGPGSRNSRRSGAPAGGARRGAGFCARGHGGDFGGARGPAAGERASGRRCLAVGHEQVGEAQFGG